LPCWPRSRGTATTAGRSWRSCTASRRGCWPTPTGLFRHRVDALDPEYDAEASGAGPDELALRRETGTELGALLATVTERAREVLTLRIVLGMTADETGAVLGISSGAVRVAQHRALVQMRAAVPPRGRTAWWGRRAAG